MIKPSGTKAGYGLIDSLNLSVPVGPSGGDKRTGNVKKLDGWLEEANERRRIKRASQHDLVETGKSRHGSAAAESSVPPPAKAEVSKEKDLWPERSKLIRDPRGENDDLRGQQPVAEDSSKAIQRVALEQHLQARAGNTVTQPRQMGMLSPAQKSNDAQGRKGLKWGNANDNAAYSQGGNWSSDTKVSGASGAPCSGHRPYTDHAVHRSYTDHQVPGAADIGRDFAWSGHQASDYTGMEHGFAHTASIGEQLPVSSAAAVGRHQSYPCHQGCGYTSMGRDFTQSELLLSNTTAAEHDFNAGNRRSGYAARSGSGHGYGEQELVQSQRMPSLTHNASSVYTQPAITQFGSDSWESRNERTHGPADGWHQNTVHNQTHWPTESSNWQYVEQHTRPMPRDHVQQPQFSQVVRPSQTTQYLQTHQMGENRLDSMLLTRFQPLEYGLREGDELDDMDFGTW